MGIFYDRSETKGEVRIKYKLLRLIFPLVMIAEIAIILAVRYVPFGLDAPSQFWAELLSLLLFAFTLVAFMVPYFTGAWNIEKEMAKAKKEGRLELSGSILSFSNPKIAIIKKEG